MKLFRFTARDALVATTLAAVWCGALSQHMSVWDAFGNDRLVIGHWRLGILCGLASAIAPAAIEIATFD